MKDTKICPYCGERIKNTAIKCRYCGEFLNKTDHNGVPGTTPPYNIMGENEVSQLARQTINGSDSTFGFWQYYFINAYFKHYSDFRGETSRKEFLFAYLCLSLFFCLTIEIDLLLVLTNTIAIPVTTIIACLVFFTPSLAITIRRLNDSGLKWTWIFISAVPIIGPIWLFILLCRRGQSEPEQVKHNGLDYFIWILLLLITSFCFSGRLPALYSDHPDRNSSSYSTSDYNVLPLNPFTGEPADEYDPYSKPSKTYYTKLQKYKNTETAIRVDEYYSAEYGSRNSWSFSWLCIKDNEGEFQPVLLVGSKDFYCYDYTLEDGIIFITFWFEGTDYELESYFYDIENHTIVPDEIYGF